MNKDEQLDTEARKKLDDANQVTQGDLKTWTPGLLDSCTPG